MYTFSTPLVAVKGIGEKLVALLHKNDYFTVKDLLLAVPLRYEDRSLQVFIAEAPVDEIVTIKAIISAPKTFYKGRKSIQSAKAIDATGSVKLMWFNNPHVISNITEGREYFISGKVSSKYKSMTQPVIEKVSENTIHTNRLVPHYSSTIPIKEGSLRRILKEITDNFTLVQGEKQSISQLLLTTALAQIHFPDSEEAIVAARNRLALEELLALIATSSKIKEEWKQLHSAPAFEIPTGNWQTILQGIPNAIPFELTQSQQAAAKTILSELTSTTPMNRLLIGDVGSGKTVVAGLAASACVTKRHSCALIAPTAILAAQHVQTLRKLFPQMPVELFTGTVKIKDFSKPSFYVGTHAVINALEKIQPALIVYDEQHRFGVSHRSEAMFLGYMPHVLTMTATPIPRTLLLTLFSHLGVSVIDELPKGRLQTKTWLIPEAKRHDSLIWLAQQVLTNDQQAIVVCPFIDPSEYEALENVAAAEETFAKLQEEYTTQFPELKLGLLHGRQKKTEKNAVIKKLYAGEIQVLVTTPMVEVGLDLPKASIIVIEAAERFGLASLHQLRGRVGRAGQQGYCILFNNSHSLASKNRLSAFTKLQKGLELAELDLQNRGSGDIFGTSQHGFSTLQFADWANLELITTAKAVSETLPPHWESALFTTTPTKSIPLAN